MKVILYVIVISLIIGTVCYGGQFNVSLYEKLTGPEDSSFDQVAFSPDGKYLASAGRRLLLWDVSTGEYSELPKTTDDWRELPYPSGIAFSPDGKILLCVSRGRIIFWDIDHRKIAKEVTTGKDGPEYYVYLAKFNFDTTKVALSVNGKVDLWDLTKGRKITTLKTNARTMAFSPDGTLLATSSSQNNENKGSLIYNLQLWDLSSFECIATLTLSSWPNTLAFSPDGKTLASGEDLGKVILWDVVLQKLASKAPDITKGIVRELPFNPGYKVLSSGYNDNIVKFGPVNSKQLDELLTEDIEGLSFSPDGKLLAAGVVYNGYQVLGKGGPRVRIWDVDEMKPIATLEGHTDTSNTTAFSPDGTLLASGSDDGTIRIWKIER